MPGKGVHVWGYMDMGWCEDTQCEVPKKVVPRLDSKSVPSARETGALPSELLGSVKYIGVGSIHDCTPQWRRNMSIFGSQYTCCKDSAKLYCMLLRTLPYLLLAMCTHTLLMHYTLFLIYSNSKVISLHAFCSPSRT